MLSQRDIEDVLGKNHTSSQPFNPDTPDGDVFGSNRSCILSPEITEGPYCEFRTYLLTFQSVVLIAYIPNLLPTSDISGEYVRSDVVEKEAGIPLTVDILLMDTTTCQPITDAYLEIWSCNSTVSLHICGRCHRPQAKL